MPVIIRNLTRRPVVLTLTSGATLHLSPNASSAALDAIEVKNNPKIDKLKSQFVIAVDSKEASSAAEEAKPQPEASATEPPPHEPVTEGE